MNTSTFEELLYKVRPFIEGQSTNMRQPITAEEKLAVTLRFLATGESYQSLKYQFRIHNTTISLFVPKVCKAIYDVLESDYFRVPTSEREWIDLANATEERWQFPNGFAAADGKHIAVYHPHDSGAKFYNYKGFYSIVLMAFVDYDYKFIYADSLSALELKLPPPRPLPRSNNPSWEPYENEEEVPFVFVADNAFPLTKNCMKPYPEKGLTDQRRIFNYILSRFRRITENAFGILTNVFRIFSAKINLDPDKATAVVKAALVLHNLLRTKSPESYTPSGFADEIVNENVIDGAWRGQTEKSTALQPLPPRCKGNKPSQNAERVREIFAEHFFGPGQVPWQWKSLV
eukprot:Seg2686.12 transcript_id=Seg2686.12/GoldUCD/mRNA.D3Y31 product="putative nuclease HARBI1" protein_id=Seg2686.12/GoldUCD/D3Y31